MTKAKSLEVQARIEKLYIPASIEGAVVYELVEKVNELIDRINQLTEMRPA